MFNASRIALRRSLASLQRLTPARAPVIPQVKLNLNYCTKNNVEEAPLASVPLGQLEKKMQMIYTCKVCSTRNSQTISKLAYAKGVIIVRCSGCQNNHLVADNLGWFRDNKVNIEDIMKEKGETVQRVSLGNEVLELVNKTASNE